MPETWTRARWKAEFSSRTVRGLGAAVPNVIVAHPALPVRTPAGLVAHARANPALPLIRDGKLRAIVVTPRDRMPRIPDVPELAETPGLEGYELVNRLGVLAPAAMPATQAERLHGTVLAALRDAEPAAKLADQGGLLRPMPIPGFRAFVAEETRRFTRIIGDANITPEG